MRSVLICLLFNKVLKLYKNLGPGILYAAAAIGVSHVVQSTRAGADFGFELVWVIIFVHLIKLPFYKVGAIYAHFENEHLIHAYQRLGSIYLYAFIIISFMTIFVVQAAVSLVTTGIFQSIFNIPIEIRKLTIIILILSSLILIKGGYQLLNKFIKVIVIVLSLLTFICVIMALSSKGFVIPDASKSFSFADHSHVLFLIAFIGWMPAPMDAPVWQSLWIKAESKKSKKLDETMFDFYIGFITTAILAILFLSIGSFIMYSTDIKFSSNAVEFSSQLISLYTQHLGAWSYPFIAIAVLLTMYSTTLTCLDVFARTTHESIITCFPKAKSSYSLMLTSTVLITSFILLTSFKNMHQLVDFATTLSFLISPLLAYMNYKIVIRFLPEKFHYKGIEKILVYLGMSFLFMFSGYYLLTVLM